jgi:L-ascorbate metabolism protein UlaG (beta-lactamase superfamily)
MATKFTWYGHGTMGLEVAGKQVLVDPYFTGNPACSTSPDSVTPDYILISHGHGDHIADAVPIAKRTGAKVISNFEIANWCAAQGISNTDGMHIGGGCTFAIGYLKLTQAMHGSALPDGSNGGNPSGFLLTTPDKEKIYLACDTGLFGDMRLIGEEGIDLAVLPIGDHFTMGPDDALRAVKLLTPKHVIPVHYNTWDPIRQDANAWAKRVEAETSAKAHVLQPGGTFTF